MNAFQYFAPTEIIFGNGTLDRLADAVRKFGTRALLVTGPQDGALKTVYARVHDMFKKAGIACAQYDGVIPNPTTGVITAGARMARETGAQVIVGLGGGSALDAAKAIAVEATHPGTAWDYLHYTAGPTEQTLPIIAVGTTAGTGSQTTPCAVLTNPEKKDKSAIWHKNIFPRVAIVDPELQRDLPPAVTAQTGFDAFCHSFEAYLSVNANPMSEPLSLEAIRLIRKYLPRAYHHGGSDMEAREQMAWADTLGGLTNASAGVTLPHGLGMQVGGHCPWVTHGQALAAIYPAFTRFTYKSAIEKFAAVGRILNPSLETLPDEAAAEGCCEAIDALLKEIDLWIGFSDLRVSRDELCEIAACGQVLGDYKNNPRVATLDEMRALLLACETRA